MQNRANYEDQQNIRQFRDYLKSKRWKEALNVAETNKGFGIEQIDLSLLSELLNLERTIHYEHIIKIQDVVIEHFYDKYDLDDLLEPPTREEMVEELVDHDMKVSSKETLYFMFKNGCQGYAGFSDGVITDLYKEYLYDKEIKNSK